MLFWDELIIINGMDSNNGDKGELGFTVSLSERGNCVLSLTHLPIKDKGSRVPWPEKLKGCHLGCISSP
jgi:hypothetical protein